MSQATDTTGKVHLLISEDRERELRNLLDRAYSQSSITTRFLPAIRWLRDQGEKLEISDILFLQQQYGLSQRCQGYVFLPFHVVRFYSQLVHSRKGSLILDPAGGLGLLGACFSLNEYVKKIDVITSYNDSDELISPLNLPSLQLHIGNFDNTREKLAAKYDAIVSIPPIGIGLQHRTFQTIGGSKIELNDETALLLIGEVADLLAQDGMLAFIVSPRIEWDKRANSIRSNLEKFGLYLSALLKLPRGTFCGTNLPFDLVIIERVDHGDLFVAEIPEDSRGQDELITRLWKRKEGPTPSKGWIVPDDKFFGLQTLEATERARKLALSKGLDPVPFNKAVIKINVPKRSETDFWRYEDHPNAIYLPEMAATKARTRQSDLPEKLKSYFQLIADPAVVLPEYLAEMLNTPIGHAIREASMKGAVIPRINKHILAESTLYLPPSIDQRRTMEALSSIQRLRSELAEFESQVWEKPRQVSSVIEALSKVNHEERFQDWLESLPFPLASILRSYHTVDKDDKEKYERLIHFFEALAEFCASIHLSAFMKSKTHWETQQKKLTKVMSDQHFSFEKPTFGLWTSVVGLFAGELRQMLSGKPEDQAVAKELYVTADSRPLEILSSKKLVSLIQQVNYYRNRWLGHGGAVTPEESINRHNILKDDLARFREIVGTVFLQYQLIDPGIPKIIIEGPIFLCRARRVMGSNPQFEHQMVELTTVPVTGTLCLHNPGHDQALKIIPLIQVSDSPQPASYFYNRVEKTEVHFVSYHFTDRSDRSDLLDASCSINKLLAGLNFKEKD